MTPLSPDKIKYLQNIALRYFKGEPISVVKIRLQTECSELGIGCKSLYKSIVLKNAENDTMIREILGSLNIKKSTIPGTQGRYEKLLTKSKNFHDLLTHLFHDGYHQVGLLLKMIENTKPKKNWPLIFAIGAASSAAIGALFYFSKSTLEAFGNWITRTFPSVVKWIISTFSSLRNIPLLGIASTGIVLAVNWYNTFARGTTTPTKKIMSLIFKTTTAGLTIGALFLSYLAAGALTLSAALLFVLSASIDVIKSTYTLLKNIRALRTLEVPDENADWETVAEYERAKNLQQRSAKTVWIKLGAAVLMTIAAVVWNFFPPSMMITVCCMAFIMLMMLAKRSMLSRINETAADNLQKNIQTIETKHVSRLSPSNQNDLIIPQEKQPDLEAREAMLLQRERNLNQQELALAERKKTLEDTLQALADGRLSSPARALMELQRGESTLTVSGSTSNTTAPPLLVRPAHAQNEELLVEDSGHNDNATQSSFR